MGIIRTAWQPCGGSVYCPAYEADNDETFLGRLNTNCWW